MGLYDDIQNKVKVQPKKTSTPSATTTTTPSSQAMIKVGRTTTGAPGTPANVSVTGTNTLNFVIPEGIPGVAGVPGEPGQGINILGTLDDVSELPETAETGDAYLVDGELYVFSGEEEWINAGPIQGPQGPQGEQGPVGPQGNPGPAATITVGNTTTTAAGSNAAVTNAGNSSSAVFNFEIPRGLDGATGAAATIAVGTVTTGAPGSNAVVTNVGNSSSAVFNFTIPRGDTGATGNSSGGGTWGSITGNVQTQTDLMTYLAGAYVGLTGAQNIAGVKTFTSALQSNSGQINVIASSNAQNVHLYFKNELSTNRGLVYWERSTDQMRLRRYATDGTTAEGELAIANTGIFFNSQPLQINQAYNVADNTVASNAYPSMYNTGSMVAGAPTGSAGTHLTWRSNSENRVGQIVTSNAGGTGNPDIWFRTHHATDNGGGWTAFSKLWHSRLRRMQADFSNADLALRSMLQTSVTDGATNVGVIPNGTGTAALYSVFNSSDPANAGGMQFRADAADMQISSFKTGTGVVRDLVFQFDGTNKIRFKVDGTSFFTNSMTVTGRVHANQPNDNWALLAQNADGTSARGGIWVDNAGVALYNASFLAGVHLSNAGTVGLIGNVTMQAGKNLKWGNQIQQHITLWETNTTPGSESSFGIGVQNSSWYARSDAGFAFFQKGTHHADKFNPGSNGKMLVQFDADSNGNACVGVGGAHGGVSTAVQVHRGAIGTQQGHYALAQGGNRIWQLGIDTDRSFRVWSYTDAGVFSANPLTLYRDGSSMSLNNAGLYLYTGWFRSQVTGTGWYHEVHGGGWYMNDSSWIKNYNNKPLFISNSTGGTVARFESASPTFEFYDTDEGYTSWLHLNGGQHGFLQHNSFAWGAYRTSGNDWGCVGNVIAYASDRRLKKNIIDVPYERISNFFDRVRIRQYDWDAEAIARHKVGFKVELNQVGSIAQEMQEAFPDAVVVNEAHNPIDKTQGKPDFLTIQWEKTIPLIIAEVQMLRKRVAELETQL